MKKIAAAASGIIILLSLTGCQSNSNNAEIDALKNQIARLEQQITSMEQQNTADSSQTQASAIDSDVQEQAPPVNSEALKQTPAVGNDTYGQTSLTTTYTMDELTSMVNAYLEKANAAVPDKTASDNLEQFFSLKQEEKLINDALDLHEDELELLYRQNALTRSEYKSLEQELEKLEDSLDNAEDRLEYLWGIDD